MGQHPLLSLPQTDYDIVGSIVLYNTPLEEVARAIRQFFDIPDTDSSKRHLCVIDNSPRPLSTPLCADERISYHFANRNLGYGRAHNLAIRASEKRTQYNLIMNTDVHYAPDVISVLHTYLASHPHAGLAAPKILYPDGRLQPVCRLLPTPWNIFLRRFFPASRLTETLDTQYELHWWPHDDIANIPFLSGSFLLMRSALLASLGGFDERFFLYAEDVDLCRRIHELSQTAYIPDARVTHDFRRQNRRSIRCTWHGLISHAQYFNKWGWFFDTRRREINFRTIERLKFQSPETRYSLTS